MTDADTTLRSLRHVGWGSMLSTLAIFLGFALGGAFGAFEDGFKDGLETKAAQVLQERYGGDEAAAARVTDKAWRYHLRAHFHWGGIGAATLAMSMLLGLLGPHERLQLGVSLGLGVGAILYPLAWLLAGRAAPGLGSTGAAKDAYELLFVGPAGLLLLGTATVLGLTAREAFRRDAS